MKAVNTKPHSWQQTDFTECPYLCINEHCVVTCHRLKMVLWGCVSHEIRFRRSLLNKNGVNDEYKRSATVCNNTLRKSNSNTIQLQSVEYYKIVFIQRVFPLKQILSSIANNFNVFVYQRKPNSCDL